MHEQLAHLAAMTESPHITAQILPFARGAHTSMFGPYVVLGFPQESALDVVLADNPTGSMWLEREQEVSRYSDLFDAARTGPLPPNSESRNRPMQPHFVQRHAARALLAPSRCIIHHLGFSTAEPHEGHFHSLAEHFDNPHARLIDPP